MEVHMFRNIIRFLAVGLLVTSGFACGSNNSTGGGGGTNFLGELFVGNVNDGVINVFNITDDGNVAPLRTISAATGLISSPSGIALSNDELFVTSFGTSSVVVLPA